MRRRAVLSALGALVVVTTSSVAVSSHDVPAAVAAPAFSASDVSDEFVAGGAWRAAVAAEWMADGRMLVIRTTGQVMVVDPATGAWSDLFTVPGLLTAGESGLLDVAVDPNFATNKRFYTYSVALASRRPQIDRFVFSPIVT
jgi:aldose sugar dehydrogenase